jgi:PAS domain S-box-containing protein
MQRRVYMAAILLILAVACLTWWILKRQLSPMLDTVKALSAMSDSSGPRPLLPIARRDEIGQLIGGFNRLLETIRQREEALEESERSFRTLVETIPLAIHSMSGAERATRYMNPTMIRMFGYSQEDIPSLAEWKERIDRAIDTESPFEGMEVAVSCKDGSKKDISWDFLIMGDRQYSFCLDLTERKGAEEKKMLLFEKEIILREVHHRIKNNMSSINSLLFLHAKSLKDRSAIMALEEAGGRVQSMMLLYDSLYKSASYNEISVAQYFPSLIDKIIATFPNRASVRVEKRIDDFALDAKRLQPLGIIMNELLTNIMKYAFVERDGGSIRVAASLSGGRVSLEIMDDGNGMPASVDFETSTGFGLTLVRALTAQLDGSIRIERGQGTRIVLEFER